MILIGKNSHTLLKTFMGDGLEMPTMVKSNFLAMIHIHLHLYL
jgi:hypothetical protein